MTTRKAATAASDDNPSELQREVRLGLVMYGGVSLAIYINGVAREFFRAVRGAGVYRFVKALTDSDVVVDVISGTSAGGINGIMLAYALCNRKEFASCANLWRLDGDIRSLLRSPHGDADSTESLFNSEGYYQPRLEAAFRDMADYVPEEGDIESDFPELDLFITGTDVDGHITTQFDDAGHPIDVKDHRSVFLLKHRRGRKTPFNPYPADGSAASPDTTFQALAKLSRITSCFPAAFTPVRVAGDKPCDDTVDGKLQLWGDLGKEATFLDGGVIDNKPFTYTIREIFNRVADREVERKLFYVEPDPERFARLDAATQPNFVQAVFASLIGIPSYESIADDLQLLAKHNSQIKQFQRLRDYLEKPQQGESLPDRGKMSGAERKLFDRETELYDKCALIALSERVVRGILRDGGRDRLMGPNEQRAARDLIDTFDEVQKEMQRHKCSTSDESGSSRKRAPAILQNFDVYYRMRRLHRTVYKLADVLRRKNEESADCAEVNKYANLWRLLNREIELLEIIKVNMERLVDTAPLSWAQEIGAAKHRGEVVEEARLIWAAVNTSLERLMGLTEEENLSERLAAEAGYKHPKEILEDAFNRIYKQTAEVDHARDRLVGFDMQTLSLLNKSLKLRSNVIVPGIDQTRAELRSESEAQREQRIESSRKFEGLLKLTSEFERKVIRDVLRDDGDTCEQAVRDAYFNFEHVDTQLYPIELVSGLYEKDIIETIRISPRDAERGFSKRGLSDKVSGDALYHFGGFFKRSWRSNDILWGRLDGLCQLVETLLDPERIGRVLKNPLQLERVRRRFFVERPVDGEAPKWATGMDPKELFPNAGAKTHKEISDWLVGLLWKGGETLGPEDPEEKHERMPEGEDFNLKLERIIEAAQLEVLHEEVPNVVTDALEEQARWNQFHFPRMESKGRAARGEKGRRKWPVLGERDAAPPGGGGANGRKGPEDINPFVYTPSEGALDPFVSVLAAAGAAHDVMRRFEQSPSNPHPERPSQTDLGRFFNNAYRIGSEALLRDMPLLVLLEILSVSLLVLRNCVLKIFGESASRIKSHPLYVVLIDFPLRAFNTLVIFMRRVPTSKKWLPVALFCLSLLLLAIGVGWRDSIIWVTTYDAGGRAVSAFYLRWFVVFIAAPLVVLFAQGVYLYQGKVNDWTWLRGLRNALIGLLLLAPVLTVIVGYVALYEVAKNSLARRGQHVGELVAKYSSWLPGAEYTSRLAARDSWDGLAGFAVTAAFLLTLVGPLVAFKLLSWLTRSRRLQADRLRAALRQYFSVKDMLEIERRLQLFNATDRERLACRIGYLSEDDLARFSRSTGLKRKLFETLGGDDKKKITLEQVLAKLPGVERDEKQRAYVGLQRALERARAGQDGKPAAAETAAGEAARAAEEFYREMRGIEDEKTILVEELVANTRRADKERVEAAGETLAELIVSKARQSDREQRAKAGKRWNDEAGKLAQLEEAMRAINPEALR